MTNIDSTLKSRDITLLIKFHIVKAMVFPVVMYRCENQTIEEGWALKNWCFQIVMLEKTIESSLDSKIKPVNPKGNQPWLFTGRTVAEAEALILRLCDVKSWFIGKDTELGKTEGKKRRRWQRMKWLDISPTQWTWIWAKSGRWWRKRSLVCYSPWDHKELDMT